MGTFHDDKGELHGITVVLETAGPRVIVGRCHEVGERAVILHDADVHDEDEQGVSKQAYLRRAAEVGVFPRHRRLAVPREEVVSVKRLGEIGLRGE